MNRRRLSPRSKQESENTIRRFYEGSGKGLVTDFHRIPNRAFGELYNARDCQTEVKGRRGSYLFHGADIPLSDIVGTYLSLITDIDVNAVALKYDTTDTSDAAFLTAKGSALLPYDCFRIFEEAPEYLGNIMVPSVDSGTVSKLEYGLMKVEGYSVNPEDFIGKYLLALISMKRYYVIGTEEVGDALFLKVQEESDTGFDEQDFILQPIIHASIFQNKRVVILCGERLYYSEVPFMGWKEIPGLFEYTDIDGGFYKRPYPGESLFHEVQNDLILSNWHGHYRVQFNPDHFWKVNNLNPDQAIVKKPIIFGFGFGPDETFFEDPDYEIQGFQGYNEDTEPRGGGEYYIGGRLL